MNLLTPAQVADRIGVSKSALRYIRRKDPSFPEPVRLTERTLRWDEASLESWITTKSGAANEDQ